MGIMIELGDKEKTALSILVILKKKFAKEKKEQMSYSAQELHKLFTELVSQINKGELRYYDSMIQRLNERAYDQPKKKPNEVWDVVDKAIERSRIKRYPWRQILGDSLTKEILRLKKLGLDVKQTYEELRNNRDVVAFINENKRQKKKIEENLKISVHARYGENNTAKQVEKEDG